MRPEVLSAARSWLERARRDLRAASVDLQVEDPLVDDALFHCQQAVEKSLKSFLTLHQRIFQKTHDLKKLSDSCVAIEPTLESLAIQTESMSIFAWVYRYPNSLTIPGVEEGQDALRIAREVCDAVEERIAAFERGQA